VRARPRTVIVTVKFPENQIQQLDQLADSAETTRSEILRRGFSLYKKLKAAEREGRVLALLPKKETKHTPMTVMLVEG